jgi:ribose/xylose/arabinose/galactoside ABC-type transport system permease subunit
MLHEQQATTPKALWVLVVAAPVILAAEMQANFVLVRQACSMQRNVALYAVIVVAMLLTIATAMIALSIWRRVGPAWFIAVLGILSSAMSFLVILAQGIATLHFDPCQL